MFPCTCCGFWTLTDPLYGSYEACPVCYWKYDPVQNEDSQYAGGANQVSLIAARQNYIDLGACEARFVNDVRPPKMHEIPPSLSSRDPDRLQAIRRGLKSAISQAARSILSGQLGVMEGCSAITSLAYGLEENERRSEPLLTFEAVSFELDDFPVGEVRNLSDPKALAQKDAEASAYVARVLPQILNACRALDLQMGGTQKTS